jgi:putative ABC transport system permease protein
MIKSNFKIALRNLWKHKVFSSINILGLAIGMSACFFIFMYVKFETSYDIFHSKADRIYRIVSDVKTPSETIQSGITIAPLAIYLKKDFPEVENAVRLSPGEFIVKKDNAKFLEERLVLADSTLFNVLDYTLLAGNKYDVLREPMSIVLSETTSKKYFGDSNPIGQKVLLTDASINATVTGVMKDLPGNSQIKADMFLSMSSYKQIFGEELDDNEWTNHGFITYILLKSNTDVDAFTKKLPAFMELHHGAQAKELQMFETLVLEPLQDVYLKSKHTGYTSAKLFVTGSEKNVYIFSVIALFILLIACINFINLTTARSVERAKEVGIRKVIGAERFELVRQFIGESVLISMIAFILSIVFCVLGLPLFNFLAGKEIISSIFANPAYLLLLLLISLLAGILAGLYPSLVLSAYKPVSVLKGRFSTSSNGLILRRSLVVFQFAISIILIVGTMIVYIQLNYLRNRDLGFNKEYEMVIKTYSDKNKDAFRESLTSIPGVISTCYSSSVPGSVYSSAFSEMQNKNGDIQKTNLNLYFVDFDFINHYNLKVIAGRSFSKDFPTDSTDAMMINESAAASLGYDIPGEAVGRSFNQWGRKGKVIGVLKDFNYKSLQQKIEPLVMRIEKRNFDLISIKVEANNLPATIKSISGHWNQVIPNKPFDFYFLDEFFNNQYQSESNFGRLFFYFAVLAIFISCLGLLGLSSYSTIQRKKEIGVRKIMGASIADIVKMLSSDFIKLVCIAFALGSPIAWFGMSKWLDDFAYRTDLSVWIFALSGIIAITIAFFTISFQAIKAGVANPIKSIRTE